jgi:osmotically-inducible protein OsmY
VTLLGAAGSGAAQDAARKTEAPPAEVIVQATRLADEQITQQAVQAVSNDPWIYSDHVTITTRNGVIRVEGIVQDTGELFRILRICRRIPGARRVVSELEMQHNDPDGG